MCMSASGRTQAGNSTSCDTTSLASSYQPCKQTWRQARRKQISSIWAAHTQTVFTGGIRCQGCRCSLLMMSLLVNVISRTQMALGMRRAQCSVRWHYLCITRYATNYLLAAALAAKTQSKFRPYDKQVVYHKCMHSCKWRCLVRLLADQRTSAMTQIS